ncbi:metal-dependent hydrolase [Pseudoxanthomonas wuyuanensis]|uniref:Inner membrane protein n=1 Tax=Pseudoxanthomonas wuyuanensis TaxID=1073196 RepID=A0A286D3Y8_9GAMM|nr:metal-dependent hydrolase [Pseudoxanthomonas wuyuanensis]KAF1719394.1 metal-dependent hydrolase [Pseudoxanthomonas wuyuanensis]SOD53379.1 inner membrane protein [Pseudoxanthomonas wuyuanensis]
MDSLSQIVLGAAVAAAIAPARHRRAALLAGAALGTLPDLDSLPILLFTDNPVTLMTVHRSFSHSLFVLPIIGWLIWWLFKLRGRRVAESPRRWFWAIQAALVTHPLLDAFTVYGTQLWWPLMPPPTMWSSVFIIDPAYTVWLLLACIVAWLAGEKRLAQRAVVAGLILSSAYLGWSLLAKGVVEREAGRSLAAMGLADAPRFSVPMPFNTLLWRVVAMTPGGYVEAEYSVVADRGPMKFRGYPSNTQALLEARDIPSVRRLAWFNRGFMRAQVQDERLVLSDLRMGLEPDYSFQFAVAQRHADKWQAIPPLQLPWSTPVSGAGGLRALLAAMWQRIWNPSEQPFRTAVDPPREVASRYPAVEGDADTAQAESNPQ